MKTGLQIVTQGQIERFTDGQVGLLALINDCVVKNKVCNFDDVVRVYCKTVCGTYHKEVYELEKLPGATFYSKKWLPSKKIDVYNEYKANSYEWTYRLRSRVKQWFISTIGILVLKGKLIVLPIIEVDL